MSTTDCGARSQGALPAPVPPPLPRGRSRGGGALLAVLWLAAALSAIALSLATTIQGETERTSTAVDGLKAYYLATGALDRAILYVSWGPLAPLPGGFSRYYSPAMPVLSMEFPTGIAQVEVIPEASRMDINKTSPEDLFRLLLNLGAPPEQAREVALAIADWRTPSGGLTGFDQFYQTLTPSFRARHASFEEIEELLLVKGMTPELYYGTYERDAGGRLVPRGGLRDCVSVFGATDRFDVNTAHPAVLATAGLTPQAVQAIVERRRATPFRSADEVSALFRAGGPGFDRLRVGGNSIFTLRASARVRLPNGNLSDLRRTVSAMVKFMPAEYEIPYHILRWYDQDWSR
ncbi:MAG: general secretion pathway protein GspK [Bryobacterales bacterium]|nr:general secretion pathway protein GspK [Bryobacterales bacterium]